MSEDRWPFHIYDEDFLAFREWLKEHDKQMREEGAKAERERVLDEVESELLDFCKGDSAKAIKQVIESLRPPAQEQQRGEGGQQEGNNSRRTVRDEPKMPEM